MTESEKTAMPQTFNAQLVKPMEQDDWFKTSAELTAVSYEMDVIHERYSGKENRVKRETLLEPLRLKCREIGERRQLLVTSHKKALTPVMTPVISPVMMPVKATTPAVQLNQVVASAAPPVERRLHETSRDAAVATLEALGYTYLGKATWTPPTASPATEPPQAKAQGPSHPALHHDYPSEPLAALQHAFLTLPCCSLLEVVGNCIQEIQSLRQAQLAVSTLKQALQALNATAEPKPATTPLQSLHSPLLSDSYMDVMDVTAMLELETMTPIDGFDEIYKHYATSFGRTPDALMSKVVDETKQRLLIWWGSHREVIRAALDAYSLQPITKPDQPL